MTALSMAGAVAGIIGAVTGIIGAIMGVLGVFHNRYLAINQYMESLEERDFIDARSRLYNWTPAQSIPIDNQDASLVVNFFHHWGLLTKKNIYRFGFLILGQGTALFGSMSLRRIILWSGGKFTMTPLTRRISNGYIINLSVGNFKKDGDIL